MSFGSIATGLVTGGGEPTGYNGNTSSGSGVNMGGGTTSGMGNYITGGGTPINAGAAYSSTYDPTDGGDIVTEDPFGFNSPTQGSSGGGLSDQAPYDTAVNTAGQQAVNYNNMAQSVYGNTAPTINDPYGAAMQRQINSVANNQASLASTLQNTANNGQNSLAYQQYQNSINQGMQSQRAVANSAAPGVAAAGVKRMAQEQNGMTAAGSIAGGQQVAANAQSNAQSQLGSLLGQRANLLNQQYSTNAGAALNQAQMQQQQMNVNNAGALGYNSLAQNEQGSYLNALEGASNTDLADEGLGQQAQQVNNAQFATYMGAAGAAGSALVSAGGKAIGGSSNSSTTPDTQGGMTSSQESLPDDSDDDDSDD